MNETKAREKEKELTDNNIVITSGDVWHGQSDEARCHREMISKRGFCNVTYLLGLPSRRASLANELLTDIQILAIVCLKAEEQHARRVLLSLGDI